MGTMIKTYTYAWAENSRQILIYREVRAPTPTHRREYVAILKDTIYNQLCIAPYSVSGGVLGVASPLNANTIAVFEEPTGKSYIDNLFKNFLIANGEKVNVHTAAGGSTDSDYM